MVAAAATMLMFSSSSQCNTQNKISSSASSGKPTMPVSSPERVDVKSKPTAYKGLQVNGNSHGATSTWVMMNRKTRKLSKIPDAVKAEIQPYFTERNVFVAEDTRKLHKLEDDTAQYICSDLTQRWSDLNVDRRMYSNH
jgi:hypothetical protein